jgi:hypothetical protein
VIRELLAFAFGGVVEFRYPPGGATCEISLPFDRVRANPD